MQYDEFIQRVQDLTGVETSEAAIRLTQAVLETLGERLYRTEQSQMAAQLPKGIKELFVVRQPPENVRRDVQGFGLEEFYQRVSARSGVSFPNARKHTKAVMAVLQEAVTSGQIDDVRRELPAEFDELFESGEGR
jgi:uncharacterized protein (DUF2267 family)